MKRIEAVELLVATEKAYTSWEDQCDHMLRTLEEAGMEPPMQKYDNKKDFQEFFSKFEERIGVWGWEE